MIEYIDRVFTEGQPFGEYRENYHFSHSAMKQEVNGVVPKMEETVSMRFGKMVDEIITEPGLANFQDPLYPQARKVAKDIRERFGHILPAMEKQVSIYANARTEAFWLPVKGRLDLLIPGQAVIDLKWTNTKAKNLPNLIEFMGYRNQLWHYCRLAGLKKAYLMPYCHPDQRIELIKFDFTGEDDNPFFREKIEKFGKARAT